MLDLSDNSTAQARRICLEITIIRCAYSNNNKIVMEYALVENTRKSRILSVYSWGIVSFCIFLIATHYFSSPLRIQCKFYFSRNDKNSLQVDKEFYNKLIYI